MWDGHRFAKFAAVPVGIVAAAVLGLSGCGNQVSTPSTQPGKASPASTLVGDPNQGMKLFAQSCAQCHSTGTQRIVGPGLKGLYSKSALPNGQPVNTADVMAWIHSGGGGMPSFGQLSDQDRADLAAYLKTLK